MCDCRQMTWGKKFGRPAGGLLLVAIFLLLVPGCASMRAKQESPMTKAEGAQKIITAIQTTASPEGDKVIVKATGDISYTSVKQQDPLGVTLLFPDTALGDLQPEYTPDNPTIKSILTSLSPDQRNVRVEIGLNQDAPYEVIKRDGGLEIVFGHEEEITAAEDENAVARAAAVGPPPGGEMTEASSKTDRDSGKPSILDRIDFSGQDDGKSQVIIGTTHKAAFDIQKTGPRSLKVRLYNTRLPEFRRNRPLITTRFESAVDRVNPIQAANATDIVIDLREWVPYRPVQTGNVLSIYFDPSSVRPRPMAAAALPDWQNALNQPANPFPAPVVSAPPMPAASSGAASAPSEKSFQDAAQKRYADLLNEKKEYTGQKIALDFYQTDIKNVFKILQQVSGKNYAVDRDVTGEVTISLEKPVPWDQVLDLILEMNQLGKVERNDIIRIAKVGTLKQEEEAHEKELEAIRARMEQEKILEPMFTEYLAINYAKAESEILPHIKGILTKDRGTLSVDARNNQIIITDTRPILEKAKEIISQIDQVTPQVLIEARIVEINDKFNRDIGMSWGVSGEEIYKSNLDGMYSYHTAMNTQYKAADVQNVGEGIIDFNFTRLDAWGTPIVLDAALRAMEEEGNGKIISSPKILTLDNKKATIRQGLRVPYQTIDENGETDTEFQDVDLSLEVTPLVTPDQRVAMSIKTTKNEIVDYTPLGDAITSTNEATTELLVDNGETVVIGGVVKSDVKNTESGFPILKDIPMIGWLFKNKTTDNSKQELLIFLTPKIIQLEQKNLVKVEN